MKLGRRWDVTSARSGRLSIKGVVGYVEKIIATSVTSGSSKLIVTVAELVKRFVLPLIFESATTSATPGSSQLLTLTEHEITNIVFYWGTKSLRALLVAILCSREECTHRPVGGFPDGKKDQPDGSSA